MGKYLSLSPNLRTQGFNAVLAMLAARLGDTDGGLLGSILVPQTKENLNKRQTVFLEGDLFNPRGFLMT